MLRKEQLVVEHSRVETNQTWQKGGGQINRGHELSVPSQPQLKPLVLAITLIISTIIILEGLDDINDDQGT